MISKRNFKAKTYTKPFNVKSFCFQVLPFFLGNVFVFLWNIYIYKLSAVLVHSCKKALCKPYRRKFLVFLHSVYHLHNDAKILLNDMVRDLKRCHAIRCSLLEQQFLHLVCRKYPLSHIFCFSVCFGLRFSWFSHYSLAQSCPKTLPLWLWQGWRNLTKANLCTCFLALRIKLPTLTFKSPNYVLCLAVAR